MGYSENCLPKALAALGHEVHLVSSNTQVYFNSPSYTGTYEKFLGPGIVPPGVKEIDGFTLHRLPYVLIRDRMGVKGLLPTIRQIRPEIVQTFDTHTLATLMFAIYRPWFGYKLFIECHVHASVLACEPGRAGLRKQAIITAQRMAGKIISSQTTLSYPISADSARVSEEIYGIDPKITRVVPLGVDTSIFHPPHDEDIAASRRSALRERWGLGSDDILAIYTGRFSEDKNPLCLAEAIEKRRRSHPHFYGLFIGSGPQLESIRSTPGCFVIPFMPAVELAEFYRAADIGVWPKQESTSQIDAACCGLPIIISDRTTLIERVEGNGLLYHENDSSDLADKLLMLQDRAERKKMGLLGAERLMSRYRWELLAAERAQDYRRALGHEHSCS